MSQWNRAELKGKAKITLRQVYWAVVVVGFILMVISGNNGGRININEVREIGNSGWTITAPRGSHDAVFNFAERMVTNPLFKGFAAMGAFMSLILKVFVFNPLSVGCYSYFRSASEKPHTELNELAVGFQGGHYGNVVKTLFLRDLYILLWSFLLIVPGIIKYFAYRQVPYLLGEDPAADSDSILNLSSEMMMGNKWNTFVLDLSFIGWGILSAFTFGILYVFYVGPYRELTFAELYLALRDGHGLPQREPVFRDPNILEQH